MSFRFEFYLTTTCTWKLCIMEQNSGSTAFSSYREYSVDSNELQQAYDILSPYMSMKLVGREMSACVCSTHVTSLCLTLYQEEFVAQLPNLQLDTVSDSYQEFEPFLMPQFLFIFRLLPWQNDL